MKNQNMPDWNIIWQFPGLPAHQFLSTHLTIWRTPIWISWVVCSQPGQICGGPPSIKFFAKKIFCLTFFILLVTRQLLLTVTRWVLSSTIFKLFVSFYCSFPHHASDVLGMQISGQVLFCFPCLEMCLIFKLKCTYNH